VDERMGSMFVTRVRSGARVRLGDASLCVGPALGVVVVLMIVVTPLALLADITI
jgi:hypothetical protein